MKKIKPILTKLLYIANIIISLGIILIGTNGYELYFPALVSIILSLWAIIIIIGSIGLILKKQKFTILLKIPSLLGIAFALYLLIVVKEITINFANGAQFIVNFNATAVFIIIWCILILASCNKTYNKSLQGA